MPKMSDHQSNEFTKVLIIGDSKSGKTGSLISLVKAGYKLFIIDMDNLLDILKGLIMQECPELIDNVQFVTLRDKRKTTSEGPVIDGFPKAYINANKMMDRWKEQDAEGNEIDFGRPSEWGPDCILVLDSLSRYCDAAYDWREPLTMPGKSGDVDHRATYGDAQDAVENQLANLTGDNFRANVIVIAHIVYQEQGDGTIKGFPQGVGQKLSPKIPQYFPTMLYYQNKKGNRVIRTTSTNMIDVANPKPGELLDTYDINDGLALIFEKLREAPPIAPPEAKTKHKPIAARR